MGLHHKIDDEVMIYPGYIPIPGVEPLLMHYGLPFKVQDWEFAKLDHHDDDLVHECNRLFAAPPYPHQVRFAYARLESRRMIMEEVSLKVESEIL